MFRLVIRDICCFHINVIVMVSAVSQNVVGGGYCFRFWILWLGSGAWRVLHSSEPHSGGLERHVKFPVTAILCHFPGLRNVPYRFYFLESSDDIITQHTLWKPTRVCLWYITCHCKMQRDVACLKKLTKNINLRLMCKAI